MNRLFYVIILALFIGCVSNNNPRPAAEDQTQTSIDVPEFNADSAYAHIQQQVDFGPRVCQSPAHAKCADWLTYKMQQYYQDVIIQKGQVTTYDGKKLNIKNIICTINPDANFRILLCSHWDSRPFCDWDENPENHSKAVIGANDGASGVGVLIELARVLSKHQLNIGIDILFFDAEDLGEPRDYKGVPKDESWCLGSQYWSKNMHSTKSKPSYGILLDMVGVPNAKFVFEGISKQYAADILEKVWNTAHSIGYSSTFVKQPSKPINDDHFFINKITGIPTIDIIHFDDATASGFFKHWHTAQDDMNSIDKNTLKAVGQTLLTLIFQESSQRVPATNS